MSIIKRNIAANFGSSIWTGLMGLVFVPLYIHFIGIEAYGLVGFFTMLLALFGLFDLGLSSTLNREMARLAVREGNAQEMRDLVRTTEIPYWAIGLLISVFVIAMSSFIAFHWVNAEKLSPKTVRTAIMLMGLAVAFQWPISLYSGGLMGLQRQVSLSLINVAVATFRGLGAVLILWLISPRIEAFFSWQIFVSAIHAVFIAVFLWRSLPNASEAPRFRRDLLSNISRFAVGITGIAVLSTILTQLDKVILSRLLSLETFGYYSLANVVAISLYRFITPVFSATFPRLTNLVSLGDTEEISRLYHKSSQLVSLLILPVALVVILFSKEILLLWTQNSLTAQRTYVLVSILVTGTALHCLGHIPYALQLAFGWTRLALLANVVSVLLLAPLLILLAKRYGAVGAACVWVILNVGYILISLPIMHRRLLPGEKWRWYFVDVGRPLLAAAAASVIGRFIIRPDWPPLPLLIGLGLVSAATLIATACAATQLDLNGRMKSLLTSCRMRHPA